MITIDGTSGGGQILRSSLSLGAILGKSFVVTNIRAKRPKPGLQAQHLACVQAVEVITRANINGAELGAVELRYEHVNADGSSDGPVVYPPLRDFVFRIGTAGSAMLLLQTVLPILLFACHESSTFFIEGGTHNDLAPSSSFIEETFLPILHKVGVNVEILTQRIGLMPEGNGRVRITIEPVRDISKLRGISLMGVPKAYNRITAKVFFKNTCHPAFQDLLAYTCNGRDGSTDSVGSSSSSSSDSSKGVISKVDEIACGRSKKPSYALCVFIETNQDLTMVITASDFKNNVQNILNKAKKELEEYLYSPCIVNEYLSDQLLLYLALGCDIQYKIDAISEHFSTNMEVISKFFHDTKVIDIDSDLVVARIASVTR